MFRFVTQNDFCFKLGQLKKVSRRCFLFRSGTVVCSQIPINTGFREFIFCHQIFNQNSGFSLLTHFFDLIIVEFFLGSEADPFFLGLEDAVNLPFGADFRFKLINCSEHIEQQPAGRVRRIDVLINNLN